MRVVEQQNRSENGAKEKKSAKSRYHLRKGLPRTRIVMRDTIGKGDKRPSIDNPKYATKENKNVQKRRGEKRDKSEDFS